MPWTHSRKLRITLQFHFLQNFHKLYIMEIPSILKDLFYVILGICNLPLICLYLVVSLPVFLYRWVLCKVVQPHSESIVAPVNLTGAFFATEFHKSHAHLAPRSVIVVRSVIEGTIDPDAFISSISSKWINATNSKGKLRYGELQQYIENWMGFMFWKLDKSFNLNNHVFFHKIDGTGSFDHSKEFADRLTEDLLNKPFCGGRSPWEFHVIHNYKSEELEGRTNAEFSTLVISRFHHTLGDGVSILNLYLEGFNGPSLEDLKLHRIANHAPVKVNYFSFPKMIGRSLLVPLKLLRDSGFILFSSFTNAASPFYITDANKSWRQVVGSSPLIPVEKVKRIRKHFGVSFSSVIIAGICAASGNFIAEKKGVNAKFPKLNFATLLPLSSHPKALTNHMTGTVIELATEIDLDPIERLNECNRALTAGKVSTMPQLLPPVVKMFALNLARICRHCSYLRQATAGLSSLPVSSKQLTFLGGRLLMTHFFAGCSSGVAGVAFQAVGYDDHIRVLGVAESAIMSREKVQQFVELISQEIDRMYTLAIENSKIKNF